MSFQPVVPIGGLAGWRFLQRTHDAQFEAFNGAPSLQRKAQHFLDRIGEVRSAEDLVKDRRLLEVALGAFGLSDDIDNRFFLQKILEDGTGSDDALANRLADDRYKRFSQAFGFGPGETRLNTNAGEMADLTRKFRVQSFEEAVGQQDDAMRIAMFAQHELADLAGQDISEDAKWFRVMGLPPLRKLFETALGLPAAFGQLDIDKQLEVFREKARQVTGAETISQFNAQDAVEKITVRYLARAQIGEIGQVNSAQANALTLLMSASG